MSASGLSPNGLERMREVLTRHVTSGQVPGLVALVARRGEAHVVAAGTTEADGGGVPMRRDAIFRIASITKQIAAAAAMTLVEDCRLRLDDPVDDLLPELANRKVLRRPDGPLDDTVPARRPITLRDLLTLRMGLGLVITPGEPPIKRAIEAAGMEPGPDSPPIEPGEWMKRIGELPLMYQPGEKYLYHTGSDVLGVLMARVTGQPLAQVLAERLFLPLGMDDSGFWVPADKLGRLPASYEPDPQTGALDLADSPGHSRWGQPPAFPSAGGGLVSTADDLLAFYTMMLNKGRYRGERVLSRPSVELMTTDQLTPEQKAENFLFFDGRSGWGLGFHVITKRETLATVPGRYGWNGGTGTTAYADPAEELTGILLTQRHMTSPSPPEVFRDFWTSAYAAIDD